MRFLGIKWDKFTIRVNEVGFVDEVPKFPEEEKPWGHFELYLDFGIYPYHKDDTPYPNEPDHYAHLSVPLRTVYEGLLFEPFDCLETKTIEKNCIKDINMWASELNMPLDRPLLGLEHWTDPSEINQDLVDKIYEILPRNLYDNVVDYGEKYKRDRKISKKPIEDYPYNSERQQKNI